MDPDRQPLFLVWDAPNRGPRSRVLARALGISELRFVHAWSKRGAVTAPFRYAVQAVRTLKLLFDRRPRLVFVQSPPSPAVLFVYLYCALTGSRYIVDAHSDAFQSPYWVRPRWLAKLLARNAVATIVTNDRFHQTVAEWGGRAFLLPDIPTTFPGTEQFPLGDEFSVAVINTFSRDEPLHEVLQAAAGLDGCQFYVTGRRDHARRELLASAPPNVHFTDFLPAEKYYALLSASKAVMCLTTRDNTMQRGACEALWLGKPIITSDWPLLRGYFRKGAVHVANTGASIRQGVLEMREHHRKYQSEILELQAVQRRHWQERSESLKELVQSVAGSSWRS